MKANEITQPGLYWCWHSSVGEWTVVEVSDRIPGGFKKGDELLVYAIGNETWDTLQDLASQEARFQSVIQFAGPLVPPPVPT
jgi:hypothetical protein